MMGKKAFFLNRRECVVIVTQYALNPVVCTKQGFYFMVYNILYIVKKTIVKKITDDTLLALPERGRFSGCTANADGQSKN
jgi:hypothetical protein